ncbi:hypothetical protein MHBO_000129 [Bonamia ostreae]|uniref:LicD/FKTN/FKRP nucleotidyltransferase domain-containing protein n=1 Tax=Bonamia ostreae TaxID=126728 RepID=A0ABV2AEG6_9EUKA
MSNHLSLHKTDSSNQSQFRTFNRKVTPKENALAVELLHVLDKILTKNKIKWCLMYGSLAGQLYFHGLIPWDDDWDIMVFALEKKIVKLLTQFTAENKKFGFAVHSKDFSKLYHVDSTKAGKYHWKWPFVDIFYGALTDNNVEAYNEKICLKTEMFPLKRGFFEGLLLPVPRKPFLVLDKLYKSEFGSKCILGYDHRNEQFSTSEFVECNKLIGKYAWVRNWVRNEGDKEVYVQSLVRNKKEYHRIEIWKDFKGHLVYQFIDFD